jgi:hypothetical protein
MQPRPRPDPTKPQAVFSVTGTPSTICRAVELESRLRAHRAAKRVEERILAGEDRVEVYDPLLKRTTVYMLPRWRDRPFARLRVRRARRLHRRSR